MDVPAEPATPPRPASTVRPLALWLSLLLLALAVGAGRLPLAMRTAHPPEAIADDVMAVTQVLAAAVLFPWLFTGPRAAAALIAGAWPMLFLAGFLAGTPHGDLLLAALSITLWLTSLALLAHRLQNCKYQQVAAGGLTLVALAGPILWYARAEFVTFSAAAHWPARGAWGPIMSVLTTLHGHGGAAAPWLFSVIFLTAAAAPAIVRRFR